MFKSSIVFSHGDGVNYRAAIAYDFEALGRFMGSVLSLVTNCMSWEVFALRSHGYRYRVRDCIAL